MKNFFTEFWMLTAEMAPYLLLGFVFAGILHAFVGKKYISQHLGKSDFLSVTKSAIFGVPMPLCSCGVIPTGVGLYRNGASKGATTSFMISTPQTGVDSILVTWSMLGLPFALLRPIVALITGVIGGLINNRIEPNDDKVFVSNLEANMQSDINDDKSFKSKLKSSLEYGFFTLPSDLAKWLIIGLFLAALVSVFVPQDFFEFVSNKPVLEMFLMLLISLPLYVCATASVPLAAVFLINGISPGAVLVFLMAGPATNIATITVIGNSLGRKTLISYLGTIILSSIIFGLMINFLFPTDLFISENNAKFAHNHSLGLFYHISAVLLILMLIFSYVKTYYFQKPKLDSNMDLKFKVKDMTCKHCVANVEKALADMDGVKDIKVDLTNKTVYLKADSINKTLISEIIQDAGYSAEF